MVELGLGVATVAMVVAVVLAELVAADILVVVDDGDILGHDVVASFHQEEESWQDDPFHELDGGEYDAHVDGVNDEDVDQPPPIE